MRHGKKFNHLSRPTAHRKALLMNQAKSLILHKRIITTVAKAKALRKFVEPIITRAKQDSTHARRVVFSYFQDKEPVKLLFNEIAPKIGDRPGGYTRIIKMGNRLGDHSEMCLIEFVDYNPYLQKETENKQAKSKTRRGKAKSKPSVKSIAEDIKATAEQNVANQSKEDVDAGVDIQEGTLARESNSSQHNTPLSNEDTADSMEQEEN